MCQRIVERLPLADIDHVGQVQLAQIATFERHRAAQGRNGNPGMPCVRGDAAYRLAPKRLPIELALPRHHEIGALDGLVETDCAQKLLDSRLHAGT